MINVGYRNNAKLELLPAHPWDWIFGARIIYNPVSFFLSGDIFPMTNQNSRRDNV
jgi:hypothetical protein